MTEPLKGEDVYRALMDLDLLLQDGDKMGPLFMFLSSVRPGHPALEKLKTEISGFTHRIERLVEAVRKP